MKYTLVFALFLMTFSSCEKLIFEPTPKTDALSVFDEYTKLITEKYAMLEFKGVNIVTESKAIRATLSESSTKSQLLQACIALNKKLRDSHSRIIGLLDDNKVEGHAFDIYAGYDKAYDSTKLYKNYVVPSKLEIIKDERGGRQKDGVLYGKLVQNPAIGYLRITSFSITLTDAQIETIFTALKDTKGLIFDVRGNGGGDSRLAARFAAYFYEKEVAIGQERFKTGPNPNDFSVNPIKIIPSTSANKYLKPVAVLTDRGVYSSTTLLCYSLDVSDKIKFIGQRTGGGGGNVADGFLANGFYWSLSVSDVIDAKGRHVEDGVDPDIAVSLDLNNPNKDEIIERALIELPR